MKINFSKKTIPLDDIEEKPFKRRRWDRYIYFGILIFFLGTFLNWLVLPWFNADAPGVLLQQRHDVQFSYDVKILHFNKKEGEPIEEGDTLFSYRIFREGLDNDTFREDSIKMVFEYEKGRGSIIAIEAQIHKRRLFLKDLDRRLDYWNSEKERKEKLVFLGAITPNELANVDRSIDNVSYEIAVTKAEIDALIGEKRAIENLNNSLGNWTAERIGIQRETPFFISPMSGEIDRIRVEEGQICYKRDIALSLIYPDYYVRAYIDAKNLDKFKTGEIVSIILPYGRTLKGEIHKIYSISELKEEEAIDVRDIRHQDRYGVIAEIIPVGKESWNGLTSSNLPVRINKKRTPFFN